jgi:hypothetical protein
MKTCGAASLEELLGFGEGNRSSIAEGPVMYRVSCGGL